MKKVLITGAAGFVGTNLTNELLDQGNFVIGVDNFFSGKEENVEQYLEEKNYSFLEHDVRVPLEIKGSLDEIYNLASPASRDTTRKDPIFTLETAFIGTKNILNLAFEKKAKILHASTSEVYGDPDHSPQTEAYRGNVNTVGPRSCYDEGKRVAETLCFEYFQKGVDVRIVRLFNTYGPFMSDDGRVIVNFILQALNNQNITVYGKGDQTRSFCFIDDLIEGLVKYMALKRKMLGPVNMGNPNEYTILELARVILSLIPESKSKIVFEPLPADDPLQRKPDISLAKKIFGWEPEIDLEEGLKKTIKYLSF